jgi:transcriptional regulator with XRE-family HTH domain
MTTSMRFGLRLRELREAAGLTQQQLADAAGLKLGGLRDIEQGASRAPRWDTVLALANALGVDCMAFTQEPSSEQGPRGPGRPRKTDSDDPRRRVDPHSLSPADILWADVIEAVHPDDDAKREVVWTKVDDPVEEGQAYPQVGRLNRLDVICDTDDAPAIRKLTRRVKTARAGKVPPP